MYFQSIFKPSNQGLEPSHLWYLLLATIGVGITVCLIIRLTLIPYDDNVIYLGCRAYLWNFVCLKYRKTCPNWSAGISFSNNLVAMALQRECNGARPLHVRKIDWVQGWFPRGKHSDSGNNRKCPVGKALAIWLKISSLPGNHDSSIPGLNWNRRAKVPLQEREEHLSS